MREVFESNYLVDNTCIAGIFENEDFGKYGNYWLFSFKAIPMLNDLRSRSLPFTTPWLNQTHLDYMQLPKLSYTNKSLSDIIDQRAIELHEIACRDNKEVWIMWSGGIDSTTLLSAFIKNIPANELKHRYSIVMSANTIAENFYFYQKFVHNKFDCINWLELDLTEELLQNTIVLHGDPANALLSIPTVAAFQNLIPDKKHLLPFRENIGTLIDGVNSFVGINKNVPAGWTEWYVNKLASSIPQLEQAQSIAAFWWWHYVNFKWHGSMLRPFYFTRKTVDKTITPDEFRYYYDTCFYINEDFQNWSYSNIERMAEDPFNYKPLMRDYIFDVDQNQLYRQYKKFKGSRRTNLNTAYGDSNIPLVYDKNWVGHSQSPELKNTIRELLNEFQG